MSSSDKIAEGDLFRFSKEKGFAPTQRRQAMQVMECWPSVMTVISKSGCMTAPYDCFEKCTPEDEGINITYYSPYFEDNRK